MVECRLALGCNSAKDFYIQFGQRKGADGKDLFSYPQYQKYESGERLLGRKASIQFAQIFKKDWEWLQKGEEKDVSDDEFSYLTEEEKEVIRAIRKAKEMTSQTNNLSETTKAS